MTEIAYLCNGKNKCGKSKNCKICHPKNDKAFCDHTTNVIFSKNYNSEPSKKDLNNPEKFLKYTIRNTNGQDIKYYEKGNNS